MSPDTRRPSTEKHWLPGVWPGVWTQFDVDVADGHDVPTGVLDELGPRDAGGAHHPGGLGGLHVHRHLNRFEEVRDSFDPVPHEIATDVVGVEMGGEHAHTAHVVSGEDVEEPAYVVGRVNDDGLTGVAVAHHITEVHHLARQRVVGGEVSAREELSEVQGVVGHDEMVGAPRTYSGPGPRRHGSTDVRGRRCGVRAWSACSGPTSSTTATSPCFVSMAPR